MSQENMSHENLLALQKLKDKLKNSLEPRVVIVGDDNGYDGIDHSEFINLSEYVIRTDYGKNLITRNLGYKTDILYIDRFNFTPFDNNKMKSDFDNYLHKKVFDDSKEIWLPIHLFLINESFLEQKYSDVQPNITSDLLQESWDLIDSREVLFAHIKHLYCHNKTNIKMLDFDEYEDLISQSGISDGNLVPSPTMYSIDMALRDLRFTEYEIYVVNYISGYNRGKYRDAERIIVDEINCNYDQLVYEMDFEKEKLYLDRLVSDNKIKLLESDLYSCD